MLDTEDVGSSAPDVCVFSVVELVELDVKDGIVDGFFSSAVF